MKRTILSIAVCLTFGAFQAQTVVIEDDFEGYQAGNYISVQSDDWSTWSGDEGGADDSLVSTDYAQSGTKSLKMEQGVDAGGPADILLPIGINDGLAEVSFSYYIPNGSAGYFNIQEAVQPGLGWAFELYFYPDGSIEIIQDAAVIGTGTYAHDSWISILVVVDIDNGFGDIIINDVAIGQAMWDTPLGGVNFYAAGGVTGSTYYVDDVMVTHLSTDINEVAVADFSMYPNPATDQVNVDLGTISNPMIRIFDLSGKVVHSTVVSGNGLQTIDVSNINQGLYIVEVQGDNFQSMKRLTIQK